MTLNDQGGIDGTNDAMNEGAGTVFYAIGTPVLIAALTAVSLVLFVQGRSVRSFPRSSRPASVAARRHHDRRSWFIAFP